MDCAACGRALLNSPAAQLLALGGHTFFLLRKPPEPAMAPARPLVVLSALLLGACAKPPARTPLEHPKELVGRWVRAREDSTWGDTLTYLGDGSVLGSTGHSVPAGAWWGVRGASIREFCAGDPSVTYCQTFRLEGDRMVVGGGPSGATIFRRVP